MHDLTISVVMCTFNGSKYIEQQLQSLCAQSCQPDEVIIYDDCSSDDTIQIIKGFEKKLNLKIFQQNENVGYIENFRSAICKARADILAYCDQDDIWHTNKLELVKAKFASNKEIAFVISDADLVDESGMNLANRLWRVRKFGPVMQFVFRIRLLRFWILLRKNIMTGMVCAVRRENIAHLTDWQSVSHDMFYIPVLALDDCEGAIVPISLVSYRQHSQQLFGAVNKRSKKINAKKYHEVFLRRRINLYSAISTHSRNTNFRTRLNRVLLNLQIILLKRRLHYLTSDRIHFRDSLRFILTYLNPVNYLLFHPRSVIKELWFVFRSDDV